MKRHNKFVVKSLRALTISGALLLPAVAAHAQTQPDILMPGNLQKMGVAAPDEKFMFIISSQPGNVFYRGEPVNITFQVTRGAEPLKSVQLEVMEIASRENRFLEGQSTSGMTPVPATEVLGKRGAPLNVRVMVEDKAGATARVTTNLSIPQRYGTYAISLAPNGKNPQFLCTVLRAMKPKPGFTTETPIVGEAGPILNYGTDKEAVRRTMLGLERLGVKTVRVETGGMAGLAPDGTMDWTLLDSYFAMLEEAHLKANVTMGAHPFWTLALGTGTPAAQRSVDYITPAKNLDMFGKWIEAFCRRYWKNGTGALWAIEHYNEPWEPNSISGWDSGSFHYRALLKQLSNNAKKVDPNIKIAAAGSVMNTEDKLMSGDDRAEMMKLIDYMTDHYVGPNNGYGPMVAKFWGKESYETETWGAATEVLLPQFMCAWMGLGQRRVSPWHPQMIYFKTPGSKGDYEMPSPTALATNVFNVMIGERKFERLMFHKHLPFAFQFGPNNDAVVVFLGRMTNRLSYFGPADSKNVMWGQLFEQSGGTITIDNSRGELEFYDMGGNRVFEKQKRVTIPMDLKAHYIKAARGGAATIQRVLMAAKIEGMRPVEIIARDFTTPLMPGAQLKVTLHNLLNRPLIGTLAAAPSADLTLKSSALPVRLAAGQTADFSFTVAATTPNAANAYPFTFNFTSDAGKAELKETMNAVVARKSTKTIDGNLDDWKDDAGVTVIGTAEQADATMRVWMPFLEWKDKQPNGSFAEVRLAYDDQFLYAGARVNDPTDNAGHARLANWDEQQFFYSAADDALMEAMKPYEKFVSRFPNAGSQPEEKAYADLKADPDYPAFEKFLTANPEARLLVENHAARAYLEAKKRNPNVTFADANHVYKKDFFPDEPFIGDTLQLAFDGIPGYENHGLVTDFDKVPEGFHALPDTDFEYAAYATRDGGTELWRLLAPGVERGHHFPRQVRSKIDQGVVPGGSSAVKREGKVTTYEVAIPWSELKGWQPKAGQTFGFTFRVNNNDGPTLRFGGDKSAVRGNGLSLHPYWEVKIGQGVKWSFGD